MRLMPILGLILASAALAQDAQQDPALEYKIKPFRALDERLGGTWRAHWNAATNTPDAIWGTGYKLADWRENSLAEARRHANQVLRDHADLLQLGASEFREIIGARMGRTWSFVFDQYFAGLPCIEGRADVRVHMTGGVSMLGSTAWQIPANFNLTPTIADLEAQAKAWLQLDQRISSAKQPGARRENRLVIWGDIAAKDAAPFYLAWEIPISNVDAQGQGPIGRYYVDAHTGAVLHYTSDKHECGNAACRNAHRGTVRAEIVGPLQPTAITPTTVTVMGWTRDGASAVAPLNNRPVPGLVVNVPGIGSVTTDQNGQFTVDIAAPVTIAVSQLDGRHCAPITDPTNAFPSASVNVTPGVPATLQLLIGAATAEQAAHLGVYWWVDTANEWVRSIVGNVAQMDTASAIAPEVNRTGTCNAFYTGNTIHFYPTAGSCNNTGFSSVAVHEWGHGTDDRFGGISNASVDGLSEGWGDIFAMFHPNYDNPIVGVDFTTAGGIIRTGLNTKMYGTQTTVHAAGEIWMGFAWRLRENLRAAFGTPAAVAISNDIVIGSVVADATNQADAVREVFIADDDDFNVDNGVPHYAQLSAAAIAKGIPYPVKQDIVFLHTPLANTATRFTPRLVTAIGTPNDGGTVTQLRLVYTLPGGSPQTRIMQPTGVPNTWRALLPGMSSGLMNYHLEGTSTTSTGRFPLTGEISYTTSAGGGGSFTPFFTENFEGAATGWTSVRQTGTATNDWQLGTPNGKSGTSLGVAWADPTLAVSSRVFGTDLGAGTANGAYPTNMNYYLRSPVINCTGRTGVTLRFRRWLTVEESTFDHAQINVNGVLVWENPTVGHVVDTSWQTFEYTLPMADNSPSVQVEFRLITDGGLQLGGWNIDDVEVGTVATPSVPGILQVTPEQRGTGLQSLITLQTDEPLELFAIVIGDTTGPTSIAPFPTLLVGGNLDYLVGFTDAAGLYASAFTVPAGMPASGLLLYTQVLVFEAEGGYSVSNQNLTLLTQ